jgi:hypothetical protein
MQFGEQDESARLDRGKSILNDLPGEFVEIGVPGITHAGFRDRKTRLKGSCFSLHTFVSAGRGPACLGQFFFQHLDRTANAQHGGAHLVGLAFNLRQLRLPGLEFRFQLPQSVRQLFLHISPEN